MKNTFGTIGLGLAGAVAAAGLMSVGVQTASAQLVISAPVVTTDANYTALDPIYDWTYTLSLSPSTASDGAGTTFGLALASDSSLTTAGASGSYYTFTALSGTWSTSFNDTGFYGTASIASGTATGGVIGTIVLVSTTDNANNVGYYGFLPAGNSNSPTGITAVLSSSNSYATDYASYNTESGGSNTSPNYYSASPYTPSQSGPIVLSPLPLPAAFWPGLLTLGGMAVVGGLRLRRRTV